jgi:catechol 2,3-dioxygenase
MAPIDPQLRIAAVTLGVSDLQRSSDFYRRVLGLTELSGGDDTTTLGADGQPPLLVLQQLPDPTPLQPGRTGLFHVAWLHPSRAGLASTVRRIVGAGWRLDGASDHGVSEALYLSDPDGLGIEVYVDRPRERWQPGADGSGVQMVTEALDLEDLLAQAPGTSPGVEPGTGVGHVHLKVSDVPRAADFYAGALGMEQMARLPSAAFLSAGGYHHHFGLNSWQSAGGEPADERAPGLLAVDLELSGRGELDALRERLRGFDAPAEQDGELLSVRDPDGQLLRFGSAPGSRPA